MREITQVKFLTDESVFQNKLHELPFHKILSEKDFPSCFKQMGEPESFQKLKKVGEVFIINGEYFFIPYGNTFSYIVYTFEPVIESIGDNLYFLTQRKGEKFFIPLYETEKQHVGGYSSLEFNDNKFAITVEAHIGFYMFVTEDDFNNWISKKENRIYGIL